MRDQRSKQQTPGQGIEQTVLWKKLQKPEQQEGLKKASEQSKQGGRTLKYKPNKNEQLIENSDNKQEENDCDQDDESEILEKVLEPEEQEGIMRHQSCERDY